MARPSLQVGGFLLLRPEDAKGALTRLAYASIVSVARAKVVVRLAEDLSDDATIEIPRRVAELRGVPRSEATGSQLGKWLRQAVWVSAGGSYRYGQVRGYSGSKLDIWTAQGAMSVTRRQLVGDVHPLLAMTLGHQEWPKRSWPKTRLQELHERLMVKLRTLSPPESTPPTAPEWLQELASDMDLLQIATAQVEWVNALSGAQQLVSLRHALLYVLYKELQGQPPHGLLRKIGKSITEEPRSFQAWVDQTSHPDSVDVGRNPSITTREFLASLSDGEVSEAEVETSRDQRQPTRTPRTPLRTTQMHAPSSAQRMVVAPSPATEPNVTDEDAAELELIEFIRDQRPHLLRTYLQRSLGQQPIQNLPAARARPASNDINPAPAKRNKKAFFATADQERVHQVITSDAHRGKSGEEYMEYLTTSSLPLDFHPGMLSRLYDIGFGSKGLSLSHFGHVGYLDRLRNAATGRVDATDFTLPVPRPPVLTSWKQLHSATRGFLLYCSEMCDPTTIRVAAALDNFALQLEGWNHWLPEEIPTLVLWINATLERYRNAAAQDALSGGNSRLEATGWFTNTNPDLQALLITALSERSNRPQSTSTREDSRRRPQEGKARHVKQPSERKVPQAVVAALPRKDGKEVCLRFLSKRGCASADPTVCKFPNLVHFEPATIDPIVRDYINTKLGGISDKFPQSS